MEGDDEGKRMAASGRRARVMICCVTFETVKATDPVRFYKCEKVYVIHYIKPGAERGDVFRDFYDRVCEILEEENPGIAIEEVHGSMNRFDDMLATVTHIIEKEQERCRGMCDIFVNISSGSPEYSAAAAIASMMNANVTPFSVNSREYSVGTEEAIREAYYRDGKPVGLTSATYEPRHLPVYGIPKPEEHLVRGLRVVQELQDRGMRSKSSDVVPVLKERGIWLREETGSGRKQSDAVRYHRDFTSEWMKRGWAEKDEYTSRLRITPKGERILKTFYAPSD